MAVGILLFIFAEDTMPLGARLLSLLGAVLISVGLFVVAALIDVALDVEENTRATFRLQQLILESLRASPEGAGVAKE